MSGIVGYVYSRCSFGHLTRNYSILSRAVTKHKVCIRRASSFSSSSSGVAKCSNLSSRALVRISGKDSENLLQGLITNDMDLLAKEKAIYTMLLNMQGRVLYDAIIYATEPSDGSAAPVYYLECDKDVVGELQRHLKIYKLRKKVQVTDVSSEFEVWAVYDVDSGANISVGNPTISVVDPRVPSFGQRLVVPKSTSIADKIKDMSEETLDTYDTHRYKHGISEGVKDLPPGNALPLEANLDYMNGVSFRKGCYLGQELTARTYHTGVIRKRLMPVKLIGDHGDSIISGGQTVKTADGKNAGKFRNRLGIYGLALIRMALSNNVLQVATENGSTCELTASIPEWWPHKSSDDVSKLHSTS